MTSRPSTTDAPRHLRVVAGDIGDDPREIEFEPLTAPSVPEPIRTPAPVPVPVPAEPEQVPA